MRVLIVSPVFPPMRIGEAEHTYHLCQKLSSHGIDVHLLTTAGVSLAGAPYAIHPVMKRWSWSEMPRLARHIRRVAPDAILLVYLGVIYNNEPMISFVPTLVRRLKLSPIFVTQIEQTSGTRVHLCSRPTRALRKAAAAWAGPGADYEYGTLLRDSERVIFLSESHLSRLSAKQHDLPDKSLVIPPPPILRIAPEDRDRREVTRRSLGVDTHHFLFAYFGMLYPGKGVETLLKAFQKVSAARPDARLALVGGVLEQRFTSGDPSRRVSYAETLTQLVRELGVKDNVYFTGSYPSDSDLGSAYLRAADACVLPLDQGVYLNNSSLGAAFAHGLPVIATQGASIDRPLAHEANVLLCPPQSAEPLADAMIRIVDDNALRATLRTGAIALAREWYDWDRATARTIAALKQEHER